MDDITLTTALNENGLLDNEGYLLPPNHPLVDKFTNNFYRLSELAQSGVKLSISDKQCLQRMHIAIDYYQEALEEVAQDLDDSDDDEDDEEGEDDYTRSDKDD